MTNRKEMRKLLESLNEIKKPVTKPTIKKPTIKKPAIKKPVSEPYYALGYAAHADGGIHIWLCKNKREAIALARTEMYVPAYGSESPYSAVSSSSPAGVLIHKKYPNLQMVDMSDEESGPNEDNTETLYWGQIENEDEAQIVRALISSTSGEFKDFIIGDLDIRRTIARMKNFINIITETKEEYKLPKLNYSLDDLAPTLSKENTEVHWKLTKNYIKKQDENEFQEAGAYLHNLWWENLTDTPKKPDGKALEYIKEHYTTEKDLKQLFIDEAMSHNGSYWIGLKKNGSIVYIENHEKINNLILVIDCWEHAYIHDYPGEKEKYLNAIWKLINWEVVGSRI